MYKNLNAQKDRIKQAICEQIGPQIFILFACLDMFADKLPRIESQIFVTNKHEIITHV